ncbi:glycosyltransferase family 2 protein [Pedobacter aquatilis]|uniref:glycosyltransferase family 2 protein n=1 Tax=Pedobacter aquatilis TaxID=351343 RepID=UPI00292F584D|nr:glycosyltransferase family 2 protein [Pedobacter aquatilis]
MESILSVIIPTYNSAKTLSNCLDSLVSQHFKDFEIWIIDGLSTDTTLEIVKRYQEYSPNINYISEGDKGIYDAMNKGIALSAGKWIYFLGSDDTLYNNEVLQEIKHKIDETSAKIIYGNVIMRGKNQWNLDNVVFNGKYNLEKMLVTNICHQSIFYRRNVFLELGNYDLKYISSADQEFNLRCYAKLKFDYVDLIVANFYVGGFSTTVPDNYFNKNRGVILYQYFKKRIFDKDFSKVRVYLREVFTKKNKLLKPHQRFICLLAYIKLKVASLVS